jgi:nitrogen regulatory protein PII
MYVLVAVINKKEMIRPVVKRLRQIGIFGATVIESTGSGRFVGRKDYVPLIGSARYIEGADITHNMTLFSVIETKEQVERAADEIEKLLGGDMEAKGTGIIFGLPVDFVRGGQLNRDADKKEKPHSEGYSAE